MTASLIIEITGDLMTIVRNDVDTSFILVAREPIAAVDVVLSYNLLRTGAPSTMRRWHSQAITRLRKPQLRSAVMALGTVLDKRSLSSAINDVALMTDGLLRYRSCCRRRGDTSDSSVAGRALQEYYRAIIEPYAAGIVAAVDFERSELDRIIRTEGAGALIGPIERGAQGDAGMQRTSLPPGNDVTIVPSAFCTERLVVANSDHGHTVVVYPMSSTARSIALADSQAPIFDQSKPLECLLGRTRAAILYILQETHTTSRAAECSAVSVATASRHLTILRDAGLVQSRRRSNEVHHELTALGETLVSCFLPAAANLRRCSRRCRSPRMAPPAVG
jgi:DNA-binding transcriptional ArsR family regulator